MTTQTAGSATAGPALTGTDGEALAQALRNLWPILSKDGRQTAIDTATRISQP
jgi:hypothetical protein